MSPRRLNWFPLLGWLLLTVPLGGCDDSSGNTATPTAASTPTRTATPLATSTPTPVSTATPSSTATASRSASPSVTATPSPTQPPTETATEARSTETPTATASATPTATAPDFFCPDGEILFDDVCAPAGAEAGFRLDIDQADNPFPDDRYRDSAGRISVPAWSFSEVADPNALASPSAVTFTAGLIASIRDHATGWGNFSPLEVKLSGPIDPATLTEGLILLRQNEDGWEVAPITFAPTWNEPIGVLDLQPDVPLESATTYAAILTSRVRTIDGEPLGRSVDFRRVLRREADESVQPALDFATTTLGIARDSIALAFAFTTQETWQDLVTIRQRLDSGDLPAPTISFVDVPTTRYQEGIFTEGPIKQQLLGSHADEYLLAAIGTAQFYDFRGRDSIFDAAVVNGPALPKKVAVRVEISIPKAPPPAGGYPVLFLGHGLGQSADFVWDIARVGSQVGFFPPFMVIAADFPNHGARGTGNTIPDLLQYFHINNFYGMRDSFRESAAELLELRRLIETTSEPPFDLADNQQILFAGASLGGINGTTFLGVDSRVRTALLSVPAGELVRILEGEEVGRQIAPLIASLVGLRPTDPAFPDFFRMLVNRGLWIMGAGDPISYAPFITGERQLPGGSRKSVLIQEGIGDGVLPNRTTEDLARVMGVPVVTTEVRCDEPGCGVSGMWQFDLADYGFGGEEPHQVSAIVPEAQTQLLTYLSSNGQLILDAHRD